MAHDSNSFIPPHGGYRKLLSYQRAEIVFDGTVYFCKRYIPIKDRTHDQMVRTTRHFAPTLRMPIQRLALMC